MLESKIELRTWSKSKIDIMLAFHHYAILQFIKLMKEVNPNDRNSNKLIYLKNDKSCSQLGCYVVIHIHSFIVSSTYQLRLV